MLDLDLGRAVGRSLITAISCATEPGSTHAVATDTAPKTPIASCTRCGMNVRVDTAPPSAGGDSRLIFGTVLLVTSPRFISGPAASRIASTRRVTSRSPSISAGASCPVRPRSAAAMQTTGMPLSMQVTRIPSTTSMTFPVGSSAPHEDPATSTNSMGTGAWLPGTPSMRAAPS